MKKIRVKNTYQLKIAGAPSLSVREASLGKQLAVLPNDIALIKPKLAVKEGQSVQTGTVLFYDKRDSNIVFLSPGTGVVSQIVYGPKRVLEQIIIDVSGKEELISFDRISPAHLSKMDSDSVAQSIQKGGLWGVFTEYPFRNIPRSHVKAPAIYVSIDNDEPYLPQSSVYLKGREDDFIFGISILKALCPVVNVGVSSKNTSVKSVLSNHITHELEGAYPANNAGVFLYHNKKDASENKAWSIKGQDVLRLAQLFKEGVYPTERMIVLAGDLVKTPSHVKIREGMAVSDICIDMPTDPTRFIAGGVLTGRKVTSNGFLGFNDYALNLIREGKETEVLTFFRPGLDKHTFGRTYLSALFSNSNFKMTSSLNGGYRSCVSCGECPKVCPTDVLPQLLMKAIKAGEMEEAMDQGFLDCASCGLCTYVCPSKIDLDTVFDEAREKLYWEVEK